MNMITTKYDPISYLTEGYIDGVFQGLFSSDEAAIESLSKRAKQVEPVQ
jgi:hypothetical protein